MAEPTTADLARQARQHLESLKANGVEWLPIGPPPICRPRPLVQTTGQSSTLCEPEGPSLFESTPVSAVPADELRSAEDRRRDLKVLAEQVSTCGRCLELVSTRRQTVFGVGPIDPELLFIGEAPARTKTARANRSSAPRGNCSTESSPRAGSNGRKSISATSSNAARPAIAPRSRKRRAIAASTSTGRSGSFGLSSFVAWAGRPPNTY